MKRFSCLNENVRSINIWVTIELSFRKICEKQDRFTINIPWYLVSIFNMAKQFCVVKECCCCINIYPGAYIIGGLGLLFGLAEVVFCILYFTRHDVKIQELFFDSWLIAVTFFNCIVLITDVIVIIGVCTRRSNLVLTWLVVKGCSIFLVCAFAIYNIVRASMHGAEFTNVIAIGVGSVVVAIQVYFLMVVNSVNVDIKKTNASLDALEAGDSNAQENIPMAVL